MKKLTFLLVLSLFAFQAMAVGIKVSPRMSYYTTQNEAEILVYMPSAASATATFDAASKSFDLKKGVNLLPFSASKLKAGANDITVKITADGKTEEFKTTVTRLTPSGNDVTIDNTTGGIMVNNQPWLPVGFYSSDAPKNYRMVEREVTQGMNLYSPYQSLDDATLEARIAYMDLCAAVGMKVNYNLCAVGQAMAAAKTPAAKDSIEQALRREITQFRNHPALLSWYIADEPDGQGIEPARLAEPYRIIKELDPYHPVSIVIISSHPARRFADSYDIIMADPYPIPQSHAMEAPKMIGQIYDEVCYEKAVWLVPQTFGGGEIWQREPDRKEIRVMCYGSLLKGAMGIQAFIRMPDVVRPASPLLWNGYVEVAMELRDIAPYLYVADVKDVKCDDPNMIVKQYAKDGRLLIIAQNIENRPKKFSIQLPETFTGQAAMIFDNRTVDVRDGVIEDIATAFGTSVFKIDLQSAVSAVRPSNLYVNPSFEISVEAGALSGMGDGCFGKGGATHYPDSRTAYDGEHSLCFVNPKKGDGAGRSFFPIDNEAERSYIMSVWGKADPRTLADNAARGEKTTFTMALGPLGEATYELTDEWKQYTLVCDPKEMVRRGHGGAHARITLDSEGTAWFDMLEICPEIAIKTARTADSRGFIVNIYNNLEGGEIRYTTDGSTPTKKSALYTEPLEFREVKTLTARVFVGDKASNPASQVIAAHKALDAKVKYNQSYHPKYTAGGDAAMTDGVFAPLNAQVPLWHGYLGDDMDMVIDLGSVMPVNKVSLGFMQSLTAWVMPPKELEILLSEDGKTFKSAGVITYGEAKKGAGEYAYLRIPIVKDKIGKKARYVQIKAKHPKTMPSWHPVEGESWMFIDEVVVE